MYYGCRLAQDAWGGGEEPSFSPCFWWWVPLSLPLPLLHIFLRLISVVVRQFVQTHFVVRLFHCDYLRLYNRSLTIIIIIVIIITAVGLALALALTLHTHFLCVEIFLWGAQRWSFTNFRSRPSCVCVFSLHLCTSFFDVSVVMLHCIYLYYYTIRYMSNEMV